MMAPYDVSTVDYYLIVCILHAQKRIRQNMKMAVATPV